MKSIIFPAAASQSITYPHLMLTGQNAVVLLTAPHTGTVVYEQGDHTLGYSSSNWITGSWKPFTGSVKLEN